MDATVLAAGTLSASGTKTVAIPVTKRLTEIQLWVSYAAMAATTGVAMAIQHSPDNASTFIPSKVHGVGLTPNRVNTFAFESSVLDKEHPSVGGPVTHVQVNLTNNDATNAATYVVLAQSVS